MNRQRYINIINNLILNIKNMILKNSIKFRLFCSVLLIALIVIALLLVSKDNDKQKYVIYNGKNINESKYPGYKNLIDELKNKHSNWTFTLLYTKLDWNDVIDNEGHSDNRIYPLNLIPDSSEYPEDWKCEIDKDKTFDNGTWLCASDKAIEYQMDPRNILNDENIFQFEELKFVDGAQTKDGIKEITSDTFLDGDDIAEALLEAGKKANLDPYFIASRLIQEQGRKGTILSQGYEYNGIIVYNPFNIKATGNSQEEIINNAAEYAYSQGWDSLEKGLIGGIEFVKEGYINKGQNTLYLQKFDVINADGELYTNQYMQNLLAPESEASNMLKIYESSDTVNAKLNFIVPLYENMPEKIPER